MEAAWDGRFASCQHRDVLGSLMALGVERECFGDIIIDSDNSRALLFALDRMEDFLTQNWISAGRASLKVRRLTDLRRNPAAARRNVPHNRAVASTGRGSGGGAQSFARRGTADRALG